MVKLFSPQGHTDDLYNLLRILKSYSFAVSALKRSPFKGIVHLLALTNIFMVALVGSTFSNPDNPSEALYRERVYVRVNVKFSYRQGQCRV